jgi:hypothetical protein
MQKQKDHHEDNIASEPRVQDAGSWIGPFQSHMRLFLQEGQNRRVSSTTR